VAAQGLRRLRFMAKSPDGRVFVTDMYNLADNTKGTVYILDEFDPISKSFRKVTPYLKTLRNPNSVAFYTDQKGSNWFYLALTDKLLRYKYNRAKTRRVVSLRCWLLSRIMAWATNVTQASFTMFMKSRVNLNLVMTNHGPDIADFSSCVMLASGEVLS
jgi:hypothetical protein